MISANFFRSKLYNWAHEHPRDYPWIGEKDPYKIWISEILLQQTRSDQAKPYYLNFLKSFPNLKSLSEATVDQVLMHWQGLGYYTRARNLYTSAKILQEQFNGQFPRDSESLQKIKGIGPYTAAAISSFAFNYPIAVLDGNVIRVFSRLLGIDYLPNTQREKKEWNLILTKYLESKNSSQYNQALMNFGSIHCKPVNPLCEHCPYNSKCVAFLTDSITSFPVKKKKIILQKRYLNFVTIINSKNQLLLQQRKGNDIWKELYQLPLIERGTPTKIRTISYAQLFQQDHVDSTKMSLQFLESKMIKLSHQELHCQFYMASVPSSPPKIKPPFSFVNRKNLVNFAFPAVVKSFLNKLISTNHVK